MRRIIVMTVLALVFGSAIALAVPAGRSLVFIGGPMGTVTFDGNMHQQAVASCNECHKEELFPRMKQGTVKITMEEIYAGRLCGVCHNGQRAFAAAGNCARCHTPG